MRKASKIIYLVAAILSIVAAVSWLIFGIIMVVIPNTDAFVEGFKEAWDQGKHQGVTFEDALAAAQGIMIACGVGFFITTCCSGVNSFFAFKAYNASKNGKPSKALNVLNIVFGVLSGVEVNIAAAIFAFIADGQEGRRAALEQKE